MSQIPLVSVIVAAYNAEKYIQRCLDSLLVQTLMNYEVIIVDDGSTDKTGAIIDDYTAKDSRFKSIHKPNGGVASARQAGLDAAKGEYTIHVDSDDWVEPEMLEELVGYANDNQSDIVICDFKTVLPNEKEEYWKQEPDSFDHMSVMGQMFGELYGSLCNKLIRRSCIRRYGLCFDHDLTVCEDQMLLLLLLSHPVRVGYIGKAYYCYDKTQNVSSLVNRGISASERLIPLQRIADTVDITPVKQKYDNAIFRLAFDALFVSGEDIETVSSLFGVYMDSIRHAEFPWYSKFLVLSAIRKFKFPIRVIRWIREDRHDSHR